MRPLEALYFSLTLASGFCNEHFPPSVPMACGLLPCWSLGPGREMVSLIPPSLAQTTCQRREALHCDSLSWALHLSSTSSHVKCRLLGPRELQVCLHSKVPGATGNLVNVVLFHLSGILRSSISDVKKSQARSFQWHMFSRNSAMTLNIYQISTAICWGILQWTRGRGLNSPEAYSVTDRVVTPSSPPCSLLGVATQWGNGLYPE